MKTLLKLLLILFYFSYVSMYAQAPEAIPYQAVARDNTGNLIINQAISLRFSIHDASAGGTVVYSETQSTSTNALGLFSVNVGQGAASLGAFSSIDWGTNTKFMQVEFDATGGSAYLDMGTQQMLSVPFALYAANSGNAFGAVNYSGTWDASSNSPALSGSIGNKGTYYVVSIAGNHSLGGITDWEVGDWAIYNGTIWQKVDNSQAPVDAAQVSFTPTPAIISTNVQDAIVEVDTKFADVIDSYIHQDDDGLTIYQASPGIKRLGIRDTVPEAPLGIKAEPGGDDKMISFISNDGFNKWNINLNPSPADLPGFSIDNTITTGNLSRLFIQEGSGDMGIGTIEPTEKLHLEKSTASGITGIKILNTASSSNQGWKLGHLQDGLPERDGAFSFMEEPVVLPGAASERMIIRKGGNVGINETVPDVKLHVSRPAADPFSSIDLIEGTGIVVLGPINEKNIVFDNRGIQAREGFVPGIPVCNFATLNLQRLGGDILMHGDNSIAGSKGIITTDAKLGLGTINPVERIDIDGAIKIGTTTNTNDGTIRWTGTDFEGRKSGSWVSLTGSVFTDGFVSAGTSMITYNPANAKVGIGVVQPTSAPHVQEYSPVTGESTAGIISNNGSTSSTSQTDNRVGLGVSCSGIWGGSSLSKNIGLYVSEVSGQTAHESNIAAVLNGNVVVGDVTSSSIVGSNGKNVLAIQNGDVPTSAVGGGITTNSGIQIFSETNSLGVSVFNVMTGDGEVIKLYRSAAITAPDNSTVGSTYGPSEQDIITNMRERINQLEAILKNSGLLPNTP